MSVCNTLAGIKFLLWARSFHRSYLMYLLPQLDGVGLIPPSLKRKETEDQRGKLTQVTELEGGLTCLNSNLSVPLITKPL